MSVIMYSYEIYWKMYNISTWITYDFDANIRVVVVHFIAYCNANLNDNCMPYNYMKNPNNYIILFLWRLCLYIPTGCVLFSLRMLLVCFDSELLLIGHFLSQWQHATNSQAEQGDMVNRHIGSYITQGMTKTKWPLMINYLNFVSKKRFIVTACKCPKRKLNKVL